MAVRHDGGLLGWCIACKGFSLLQEPDKQQASQRQYDADAEVFILILASAVVVHVALARFVAEIISEATNPDKACSEQDGADNIANAAIVAVSKERAVNAITTAFTEDAVKHYE